MNSEDPKTFALPGSEKTVRLSSKGALRESGGLPKFELNLEPGAQSTQVEHQRLLADQLDSVDFYIEQGFFGVALVTLERLETVFPNHPAILARLERMAALELGLTEAPILNVVTKKSSTPLNDADYLNEEDKPTAKLNNPSFRVPSTGDLIAEEPGISDVNDIPWEWHPNAPTAQLVSQTAASVATVDQMPNVISEFVVEGELPSDNTRSLEKVKRLLAPSIDFTKPADIIDENTEAEFQNHFNVGQAYLDIELVDDAIEEFQAAYRQIQRAVLHPQAFPCCMLLGRCFRLQGMPRPAIIWLRRALELPGRSMDEYLEAHYELAIICQEIGDKVRALENFQKIAAYNPQYQDVAFQIQKLITTP
jgi:tetratricopeptide (TPR) repeat protein